MKKLRSIIEQAWEDRSLLSKKATRKSIKKVIKLLDQGLVRVAEPTDQGDWQVNQWVKKAVVLYFPIQKMKTIEVGPFEFHDKIPLKTGYKEKGIPFRAILYIICSCILCSKRIPFIFGNSLTCRKSTGALSTL